MKQPPKDATPLQGQPPPLPQAGLCNVCLPPHIATVLCMRSVSKWRRGRRLPVELNLAEKLPFMDSRVMRSSSAVCMLCPASGEVGVMVPEEAALAAI